MNNKEEFKKAFYCEHIHNDDEVRFLINNFVIKKKTGFGLVNYLRNQAIEDEKNGEMRTYLVRDRKTDELVGYFSLKTGIVSRNETGNFFRREFDSIPGIELANFAVNDSYKESHPELKGLGAVIFYYFLMPIVKNVASEIGAKMLCIYALPYKRLIEYYKRLNFERLPALEEYLLHRRIKPRYDQNCIFMCQPIPEEKLEWLSELKTE